MILVVSEGQVAEVGTHSQLMEQKAQLLTLGMLAGMASFSTSLHFSKTDVGFIFAHAAVCCRIGENNVQFLGQTFTAILGSSILLDLSFFKQFFLLRWGKRM